MTHRHQHTLGDSQAETPGAGKCVRGEWDYRFVCKHWSNKYIHYIFSSVSIIDASFRLNLLEVVAVCIITAGCVWSWAGVGEALRWNWRHNDSLSPQPQTLARSSHRETFPFNWPHQVNAFSGCEHWLWNSRYLLDPVPCWCCLVNWELRMTFLLSICLCSNVSLCHGTTAWYRLRKPRQVEANVYYSLWIG